MSTNEYKAEHYDRVVFLAPKGEGQTLKREAAAAGKSVAEYIRAAIEHYRRAMG